MGKTKKRSGYSLVELVVVIIIIGILAAAGVSFGGKQISKARMTTITSDLKIVANDVESAIVDLGFLDKTEILDAAKARNYFQMWDSKYLTSPLDLDSIVYEGEGAETMAFGADFNGVHMFTKNYKDPWGNELQIFYLAPTSGKEYRILIASAGPNSKWATDAANGYTNSEFEDDVVMVMTPRN